jgi:hypothetical protein
MTYRNKISISFLPYDEDIWSYIQNKKKKCNISEYIRNLIRNDMENGESKLISEEKIIENLLQRINFYDKSITSSENEETKTLINVETKNTIDNLF